MSVESNSKILHSKNFCVPCIRPETKEPSVAIGISAVAETIGSNERCPTYENNGAKRSHIVARIRPNLIDLNSLAYREGDNETDIGRLCEAYECAIELLIPSVSIVKLETAAVINTYWLKVCAPKRLARNIAISPLVAVTNSSTKEVQVAVTKFDVRNGNFHW